MHNIVSYCLFGQIIGYLLLAYYWLPQPKYHFLPKQCPSRDCWNFLYAARTVTFHEI